MKSRLQSFVLACAFLPMGASTGQCQDDEIMLTTPATRERVLEAMNAAALEMQTTGQTAENDRWRSGIITRYKRVFNSQARVAAMLDVSNVVHARFRQAAPDTLQVTFRAQVSAQIAIMPSERSALAREILMEFVQRTRRQLAAAPGQ